MSSFFLPTYSLEQKMDMVLIILAVIIFVHILVFAKPQWFGLGYMFPRTHQPMMRMRQRRCPYCMNENCPGCPFRE